MITKPTNTVIGQNIELLNPTSLVSLRTSGQVVCPSKAVMFNSSMTLDLSTSNNFYVVQTDAINFNAPINAIPGQSGSITLIQDSTGGRTITFNASVWKFIGGVMPTPAQVANSVNVVFYYVDSLSRIITQMVPSGINVFTGANYAYDAPGTYSLVVPAGASTLIFSGRGGGGGGGGGSGWWAGNENYQTIMGGGGGSSGANEVISIPVTSGSLIEVEVGTGGNGGNAGPTMTPGIDGSAGNPTIIRVNSIIAKQINGGNGGLRGWGGWSSNWAGAGITLVNGSWTIPATLSLGGLSSGPESYGGGHGSGHYAGPSGGGGLYHYDYLGNIFLYNSNGEGATGGIVTASSYPPGAGGGGGGQNLPTAGGGNGENGMFGGGGGGGDAAQAGGAGAGGYAAIQLLP